MEHGNHKLVPNKLAYFSSRGSVTKINPIFFWLNIYQLNRPICNTLVGLFYTTKESNIHDWHVTSFLLQCKPNTLPKKGVASTHEYVGECTLMMTYVKIKRYARKRIYYGCLVRIEKSIPQDHCLALLGKASWCQTVTLGQIFLSAPHTHEKFIYSPTLPSWLSPRYVLVNRIIIMTILLWL